MSKLLFLILLVSAITVKAQKSVLSTFDFSKDGYDLYVFNTEPRPNINYGPVAPPAEEISIDSTSNYYTNNKALLNEIKIKLKGKKIKYVSNCSPNYFISITYHDSVALAIEVRFCSKELIVNDSLYYTFDPEILKKLLPRFNRLEETLYICQAREQAIKRWETIKGQSDYKVSNREKWLDFEGNFSIILRDTISGDSLLKKIKSEAISAYPSEKFEVSITGGGYIPDEPALFIFDFECNKSFYDKFQLYKKQDWDAYSNIYLTSYKKLKH